MRRYEKYPVCVCQPTALPSLNLKEKRVQSNAKWIKVGGIKGYKAKKWKFFQVENHVKCNRQPLTTESPTIIHKHLPDQKRNCENF